jgi:ankyrin repeat protein
MIEKTPLMLAVTKGALFDVYNLLENAVDIHTFDLNGNTALHHCIMTPQGSIGARLSLKISGLLIQYGADPNDRNINGLSCYDLCDSNAFKTFIENLHEDYRTQLASTNIPLSKVGSKLQGLENIKMSSHQEERIIFFSQ